MFSISSDDSQKYDQVKTAWSEPQAEVEEPTNQTFHIHYDVQDPKFCHKDCKQQTHRCQPYPASNYLALIFTT